MSRALQKYLDHVMIYANRKEEDAAKIRLELEDHLRQKITELEAQGAASEDAVSQAIKAHGSPRTVGYGLRKGVALLDVRTEGTARGIVAIGPRAVGVVAFGAVALAGLVSRGGLSVAPLGIAAGLAAAGRTACGIIAGGGLAVGLSVPWAIEQVSLLGDEGFQFLQQFRTSVPNSRGDFAVGFLALWMFMVFPFLNGIMCSIKRDEYRRIKKADPDIDVSVTWP